MPELPEVETMRRGILGVVGSRITGVEKPRCRYRPILLEPTLSTLRRRTIGRRIERIDRLGKRVILVLDDQSRLLFEPRMTGLVLLADPPDTTHLRLALTLTGTATPRLWYWDRRGLGQVRWLDQPTFQQRYLTGHLGPDALQISAAELRQRLQSTRRPLKVALLDQRLLAGVGNLYASEILHLARLHPALPADRLTGRQAQTLHRALREILEHAVQMEGSTLSDGTYRNALNQSGSYQNYHRVYDRAGTLCTACGRTEILRIVQAQRATFYCPTCQPPPRLR